MAERVGAGEALLNGDRLLTPAEVADLFRVDPKTVTRWAHAGRLPSIRTAGGHRRFRASHVKAMLEGNEPVVPPQPDSNAPWLRGVDVPS